MKVFGKVASALSFAHLAGIGSRKARAESDEDDDKKNPGERDQEDGNVKKSKKAEDDKDKDYAEDTGEDEEASGDDQPDSNDGDEDDKGDKKGKKAKAEDEDAEDDDKDDRETEMRGTSPLAKARRREQARCASIFASPAAARNPTLAANLAFKTRMTRTEALAVLEGTPTASGGNNSDRSARNPKVGSGGSSAPTSQQAVAASLDAAFAKANPTRRRA